MPIRIFLKENVSVAWAIWDNAKEVDVHAKILQLQHSVACAVQLLVLHICFFFTFLDYSWETGWNIQGEAERWFWSLTMSCINQADLLESGCKFPYVMLLQYWYNPQISSEAHHPHCLHCFHLQGRSRFVSHRWLDAPCLWLRTKWIQPMVDDNIVSNAQSVDKSGVTVKIYKSYDHCREIQL